MTEVTFYPGQLYQWKHYNFKNFAIWVAGYQSNKFINDIANFIKDKKVIDKNNCKKIISFLGDNFGIIIICSKWTFAAVDYSRGYPIYYRINNRVLQLSSQANFLKEKKVDDNQLTAFRMSGYTINEGTLWKKIKSISAGKFLFYKNQNQYICKEYFTYLPRENLSISYRKYQGNLKRLFDNLIKNIIKRAQGKTIIIPLSAGLDSRLIASGLKHFNYKNVKCFSYGIHNNYESNASRLISKKLGYDWIYVEITHNKARKFYKSKAYKDYITKSIDGCATSTIQGLFAIDKLIKNKYIKKNDIVINGNSGDFISGGHIPLNTPKFIVKNYNLRKNIDKVFKYHFEKHYSLWESLKTRNNKNIIKKELLKQLEEKFKIKEMPLYGLIELLEYDNRQTKYVVNSQRIYDFYQLQWLLPLWNKSFISFWEKVPMNYKLNQKLYRDTLKNLNYGNVWTKEFDFEYYLSPKWFFTIRFFLKVFFLFIGKSKWRIFEKRFINYWTENIYGFSSIRYFDFIKNKNIARNYVSIYTLVAEKNNLGSNWQNKEN